MKVCEDYVIEYYVAYIQLSNCVNIFKIILMVSKFTIFI